MKKNSRSLTAAAFLFVATARCWTDIPTGAFNLVLAPFGPGTFAIYAGGGGGGIASFSVDVTDWTTITNLSPMGIYDDGLGDGSTVQIGFTSSRSSNGSLSQNPSDLQVDPITGAQDIGASGNGAALVYGFGQTAGDLDNFAPPGSTGSTQVVQKNYDNQILIAEGTYFGIVEIDPGNTSETIFVSKGSTATEPATLQISSAATDFVQVYASMTEPIAPSGLPDLGAGLPNDMLSVSGSNGNYSSSQLHLSNPSVKGALRYGGIMPGDTVQIALKFTDLSTGTDPATDPDVLGDISEFLFFDRGGPLAAGSMTAAVTAAFPGTSYDLLLTLTDSGAVANPYFCCDLSAFSDSSVAAGDLAVTDIGLVPEPASIALLVCGSLLGVRRRRD
jgi:hypothetical protein